MSVTRHPSSVFLGALLTACAITATASDGSVAMTFDIEPKTLNLALNDFAKQSGLQVVFAAELGRDLQTTGLNGRYTVEAALNQLLANAPLAYDFLNPRTVTIRVKETARRVERENAGQMRLAQTDSNTPSVGSGSEGQKENAAGSAGTQLEEIVVTAQKRAERLQDVPISITALSGDDLDRSSMQGIHEALNTVPGVATLENWNGMGARVAVRGVSAPGSLFNGSSPIGYYLDAMPFAMVKSAFTPDANAYDLERVEVLRGPQGTRYGASSLNGVVRILTQEPKLDELEWKARGTGSQTAEGGGTYRADMTVNVPLVSERLAARVTGGYENLSGWIDRPNRENANDVQAKNLRLKLKAQPTDRFSADWSSWLSRTQYGAPNVGDENQRHVSTVDEPNFTDYDAHALKLEYDFASFSVAANSSYLDLFANSLLDFAPFGIALVGDSTGWELIGDSTSTSKVFAQEVLFSSNGDGVWRWSLGAMYRDNKDRTEQFATDYSAVQVGLKAWWEETSESMAFFGELTRVLMDGRLELTGGLRDFRDQVATEGTTGSGAELGTSDRDTFHKLTPLVTVTGHVSDDLMVYATYSQGFRSGALQTPFIGLAAAAKPDELTNYEVGTKGTFWNNRLSVDTSIYYLDWQQVQQVLALNVNNGQIDTTYNLFTNGESASGLGVDFALTVRPMSGLELGATLSVNDLEMDADAVSANGVLYSKGERLDSSPKETYGAFASYEFALGSGGYQGGFSASANYTSPYTLRGLDNSGLTIASSDSQLISRLSFSVHAPKNWDAMIFVNNLNNEQGIAGPSTIVPIWSARPRPRTYGVQLQYHFE